MNGVPLRDAPQLVGEQREGRLGEHSDRPPRAGVRPIGLPQVVLAGESWSQRSVYALPQPVVATRAWRSGGRPGAAALLADGSVVWVAAAP